MAAISGCASSFSLTEARSIVRDLFKPVAWIYWVDFVTTILVGHLFFALTRLAIETPIASPVLKVVLICGTFAVQCACYYRAVMFVHELVHLPEKKLRLFRIVWNLLCGIPFLVPSFTYYTHLDHHRGKSFGTEHDGEYLSLAKVSPGWIVVYLTQGLWVPLLAILRFGLLTPLTWVCRPLQRLILQRASSLVMDPSYVRPVPNASAARIIRLQEVACFLFLVGVWTFALCVLQRWPILYLIQGYATAVVLVTMNAVRTLASHRWTSDGEEGTFVEQMLDSVTLDSDSLLAILINPVGLRYHATHHLFPSMPYHNMRRAHKRLMSELPADSPYRRTVSHSIWPVIVELWEAAARNGAEAVEVSQDETSSSWQVARSSL
jgi:fatty acid desaturase